MSEKQPPFYFFSESLKFHNTRMTHEKNFDGMKALGQVGYITTYTKCTEWQMNSSVKSSLLLHPSRCDTHVYGFSFQSVKPDQLAV